MKISNESKVGIFTAVTITILVLGYNFLKGRDLFTRSQTFYAVFDKVDGLVRSNPVYINGYKIGQVSDVSMQTDDNLKLMVEIEIASDIRVPDNSTIKIYSPEILGGKAIELLLGDSKQLAENKSMLNAFMEPGLTENLNKITLPLREKLKSLMSGLDSTLSNSKIDSTLQGLPDLSAQLKRTGKTIEDVFQGPLTNLLNNANAITQNVEDNNAKINRTMSNLESFSDTLAALELSATIMRVEKAMAELEMTLNNVNSGEGTLGKLAKDPALYDSLKQATEDLDKLLVDLKKNPKKYVHFSIFGKKQKATTD